MTTRTTSKTVTFTNPFVLGDLDEVLPAGDYLVETDEELLQDISFPAYMRVSHAVHINHVSGRPGIKRTVIIAPQELDAALARDRDRSGPPAPTGDDQSDRAQADKKSTSSADRSAKERAENEGMLSHVQQGD